MKKYMLCNAHKEGLFQYGVHDTLAEANERLLHINSLDCGCYAKGIIECVVEVSAKEQALDSDRMLLDVMQRHMNRYYQDSDVAIVDDMHCYLSGEADGEKKKRVEQTLGAWHDKRYGAKEYIVQATTTCLREAVRNMLNDIYPD